jgi:hypothetical protein
MKREETWRRWVGHQQDLADAVERSANMLTDADGEAPTVRVELLVPPYTFDADSVRDLTSLSSREVKRITSMRARVARDGESIWIRVGRNAPAVTLEVEAGDAARVDGIVSQIARLLDQGRPFLSWLDQKRAIAFAAVASLAVDVGSILAFADKRVEGTTTVRRVSDWFLIPLIGGWVVLGVAAAWLVPNLEILPAGAKSRVLQARGLFVATIVLASAVAGLVTVLYALLK